MCIVSDKNLKIFDLFEIFYKNTETFSEQTAVYIAQTKLTFRDIFIISENLANKLRGLGICEENILGFMLPNTAAFIPVLLSLFKLSVSVAMVSPKYRESDITSVNNAIKPVCYITTSKYINVLKNIFPGSEIKSIEIDELSVELFLLFPQSTKSDKSILLESSSFNLDDREIAIIKFTSGSTGTPKAIACTVENMLSEAENVVSTLSITPDDFILAPVPLFHSYGFDLGVLPLLYAGVPMIINDNFIPRFVAKYMSQQKVSVFLGVPSIYRFLLETHFSTIPDLTQVKYLLSCTAPLHPNLITSFYKKFNIPICQHYGSSESGAVANHIPSEVLKHNESVGKAMKNVNISIVDQNGDELPYGEEGEVVVNSKVVAAGYLMGEMPGKSAFSNGKYYTGDIGFIDEEGFLFLRGRKDQMINVGGLKVSPYEVMQVLNDFPAISESAILGLKDKSGEEFVYAAVILKTSTTESKIIDYCKSRLADYKIPRRIDFWKELPKSDSGKIILKPEDIKL